MADTPFTRTPRAQLPEEFHLAWDTLNGLTGEPAFVEVRVENSAPGAPEVAFNSTKPPVTEPSGNS